MQLFESLSPFLYFHSIQNTSCWRITLHSSHFKPPGLVCNRGDENIKNESKEDVPLRKFMIVLAPFLILSLFALSSVICQSVLSVCLMYVCMFIYSLSSLSILFFPYVCPFMSHKYSSSELKKNLQHLLQTFFFLKYRVRVSVVIGF